MQLPEVLWQDVDLAEAKALRQAFAVLPQVSRLSPVWINSNNLSD